MKISTETGSISQHVGIEKAVELIAKAGFDAFDFSLTDMVKYDYKNKCVAENDSPLAGPDYLKFARKIKGIAEDNGIVCNQSHAASPVSIPEIRGSLKRAIECTAEAGGEICVIHPDNNKSAEENAEMYLELLPFAKGCGVKIATENMWNWDHEWEHAAPAACSHHTDFLAHIEAVNDDYFVACLDIGHAELMGLDTSAISMIKTLKNHIQALHIHDVDRLNDNHQIPGCLNVNFSAIVKTLKKIDYSGYFTLEPNGYIAKCETENIFEGVVALKNSVRHLADMYEKF